MHEILYIHPRGHFNDLVVPAGAISCLNAVDASKLGRYSFEVTDDEIREARVVAIDLHWGIGLAGFEALVAHVRGVSPFVPIVVGGITASHYARALLEFCPVDYVIRGDAEASFVRLVRALLAGKRLGPIPNVFSRGVSPPLRRMSAAQFDGTDTLTTSWFPTFDEVADLATPSIPQARTVVAVRGCTYRCPGCYGSHASTFGDGVLARRPASWVRELRRLEALEAWSPRLLLGGLSPARLAAFLAPLATERPFVFGSRVGFFLCTPPAPADLAILDRAFPSGVILSAVAPQERLPALPNATIRRELQAWRGVVAHVKASPVHHLDLWVSTEENAKDLRVALDIADADNVSVSLDSVWNLVRPQDGKDLLPLAALRDAVAPVWTFFAARLISPPLARALAPFGFLDELQHDPQAMPKPDGVGAPFWSVIVDNWRRFRLPTLPGLGLQFAEVALARDAFSVAPGPIAHAGVLARVAAGSASLSPGRPRSAATVHVDHRGVRLEATLRPDPATRAFALVPLPPGATDDAEWARRVCADEVVVVRLPTTGHAVLRVVLSLRVQELRVAIFDADERLLGRGRATPGFFKTRSRDDHQRVMGLS